MTAIARNTLRSAFRELPVCAQVNAVAALIALVISGAGAIWTGERGFALIFAAVLFVSVIGFGLELMRRMWRKHSVQEMRGNGDACR
ncbi:MAG: hypothetical protein AB3N20_22220 [Rhizobiaceae bacterium]